MAADVVSAAPFTPVKPVIRLIDGSNAVQIQCAAEDLAVEVDQDEKTTETFDGTFTTYKSEVWTITAACYQSYNATGGLWNLLRPYVGKAGITFELLPDITKARGVDNPLMSGSCLVKAFPFYEGSPGEPKNFDVVIAVSGTPSWSTAAGAAATSALAGKPGMLLPVGAGLLANAAAATAGGVTAVPATAWTTGQYIKGTSADFYWNNAAWTAGRAP